MFWRTAGSGNRATVRSKSKKRTFGGYGDIAATDPIGLPLLDALTISLKDGYKDVHVMAVVDQPQKKTKRKHKHEFIQWLDEIEASHREAGSFSWIIIHKRKGRAGVVYMPYELYRVIEQRLDIPLKLLPIIQYTNFGETIVVVRQKTFFEAVTPDIVKAIAKHC